MAPQETVVDEIVGVSVERLFRILFRPEPVFIQRFYQARAYWDIVIGPWLTAPGAVPRPLGMHGNGLLKNEEANGKPMGYGARNGTLRHLWHSLLLRSWKTVILRHQEGKGHVEA
jgi:VAD1 Analog of StAR-related lipid transfer domain